jgi:hypothetical protein
MAIDIFADLFLSNGEKPTLSVMASGSKTSIDFGTLTVDYGFKLEIANGLITVHFTPEATECDFWEHWDNVFELAKMLIDPIMLARALHLGQGLLYNITSGKAADGKLVRRMPDMASEPKFDLSSSKQADPIIRLLANNSGFKWAARDFNMGLIDRKDCTFYFYREVETLAKIIGGENKDEKPRWDEFYRKIGASEEEIDQVRNGKKKGTIRYCADKLRHGTPPGSISLQKWEDAKRTAKSLLKKSAHYLITNKDS